MTMCSASDHNKPEIVACSPRTIESLLKSLRARADGTATSITKLAKDDPRRVFHSLKVALALTLVSLFYYFQPLYNSFGVSAMWAVITVVVVFEFYVGATLGKGLNRALATLLAGVLGVGAHLLAGLCSKTGEPIIIGLFVFLQAVTCTFLRFFPKIKARYDYGLLVFMLTFCMISITGVRQDEIMELAHKRLATIALGALASLLVSTLVCPVWAGEDLHNLVARNIESVANYLEGFGTIYFNASEMMVTNEDKWSSHVMQGYKSVLNSKGTEETLANFASWEPPHGKFKLHHPWKHYLKLGALARQCSYRIDTLNTYVNSEIQGPLKMQEEIGSACMTMSSECSKALKLIAAAIIAMACPRPCSIGTHIASSKDAMERLKVWLDSSSIGYRDKLPGLVPVAIVATLLGGIVECTDKMAEAANELACLAKFEGDIELSGCELGSGNEQMSYEGKSTGCPDHVVIAVSGSAAECDADDKNLSALDLEMNGQSVEV